MSRIRIALCTLWLASCTIDSKSLCPNEYTPDDLACAWRYCQGHADEPRCADAAAPLDGGPDARVGLDAQVDATPLDAAADAEPVDAGCRDAGDCPAATPYCQSSGACGECAGDGDCPGSRAACVNGTCQKCASSSSCARLSSTPVCEVSSGSCVSCTGGEAALCTGAGQVCASEGTTCVACNANAECPSASASRCAGHACEACQVNADCAHVSGKPVCSGGTCVACTVETEAAQCGETSCDPETKTCTGTKRGTLATCRACRADSECLPNRKCVPVPYMGSPSGSYCMQLSGTGCSLPFAASTQSAVSKSGGAAVPFCVHNTAVTTCDAIVSLTSLKSCSAASVESECGKGASCEKLGDLSNRCTYACSSAGTCPSDYPCNDANSDRSYCGGPTQ